VKRRAAIATAFAACLSGCGRSPVASDRPRWPALPVTGLTGQPATLPATSAQPRIINMWALWCGPCRVELPALERLGLALGARGVQVSAIALADEVFPVREYLLERAARLPGAVLGPKEPVVRQLGLDALPQTFVVARDGGVLAAWVGARDWDAPHVRAELDGLLRQA
jgi:cytochrome c biogenesis protein CcmG/thiol:disulfide interchange protein DsbE